MACPNRNLKEYQDLIAEFGEGKALAAFTLNGDDIPTIEQAKELLTPAKDIMFQLSTPDAVDRVLTGFKNLSPKFMYDKFVGYSTGGSARDMANRINKWLSGKDSFKDIKAISIGAYNTIAFQDKVTGKLYQLTSNKQLKHDLQQLISGTVQRNSKEGTIRAAADVFRTSQGTSTEEGGFGQDTEKLWRSIQEAGLEFTGKEIDGSNYFKAGSEHIAHKIGDKIIKERFSIAPELIGDYLNSLLVHNYLFPEISYKLLGFTKFQGEYEHGNYKGNIIPVVEQDFANSDDTYDYRAIESYLSFLGFKRSGHLELRNEELGIMIYDLYARNVLFNNGAPIFIDPIIELFDDKLIEPSPESEYISTLPDEGLNTLLKGFAEKELGARVDLVQDIIVDGRKIAANAITDVVKRTIQLADGKIQLDTLPEEVAHIWVHWLPKNSVLLRDMMRDIRNRPLYDQVMEEYKDNNHYQNEDGTVNEDKIAIEAIGKMIAGAIVEQYKDKKAKTLLQRLIQWIKGIFKGKDLQKFTDSYQESASRILEGDNYNDIKTVKHELQDIIEGKSKKTEGDTIQAALDFYRGISKTGSEDEGSVQRNKRIQKDFIAFAKNNLWYNKKLPDIVHASGKESIVYKDGNNVIKVNNGRFYDDNWDDFLRNILLHNEFFPATGYTLLGFTDGKDGAIQAVVQQKLIVQDAPFDRAIVDKYLEEFGFEHMGYGQRRDTDYSNSSLGIAITDLHSQNVIIREGEPFFIDTVFTIYNSFYKKDDTNNDIKAAKEANNRGEYYFQLSKEDEDIVKSQLKKATAIQQKVVNDVYLEPHSRIILDPVSHIYSDLNIENPTIYTSVTTAIGGKKDIVEYDDNRLWGNDFDGVLSDIIQGKDIRDTPSLSDKVREQLIPYLQGVISGLTADGSIALTQVIVADKESKVAGSIDLLLVDPMGNMKIIDLKTSWNSIYDKGYTTKYTTGEGAIITTPISKAQSHSIQVGTYAKLVNLLGYPVAERRTYHLLVKDTDGIVTSFTDQGMIQHVPTENESLVNKIVPTVYQGKDRLAELQGREQPLRPDPITEQERIANTEELQQRVLHDILPAYESWRDYLDDLQNRVGYIPEDSSIRKVHELITHMEQEFTETGGYSRIYTKFLTTTLSHLNGIMKYLTDPENIKKDDYVRGIFLAKKYIDTFKDLFHTEKFADPHQQKLYLSVEQSKRNVDAAIVQAIKDNTEQLLAGWSTNPIYTDTTPVTLPDGTTTTKGQQALTAAVTRNKDISQATMLADTIGNSGIPVLENINKQIAAARAQVIDNTHTITEQAKEAGNNLIAAMGTSDPRVLYGWMLQKDSNGKKNGQIISQIGTYYKEVQTAVTDPLFNLDGTLKQYIEKPTTDEELQWNKDLYYLKRAKSDFLAPEITEGDRKTGKVSSRDGDYHMLTEEFKKQRDLYMKQDPRQYGKWIPKNEKDAAFIEWRAANYDWNVWIGPVVKYNKTTAKLEPTGQVETKQDYFIKKKNSTAKMEGPDGAILWDKEYMRIMNPQNAIDRAQAEFYKAYVSILKEQVQKLPAGAMQWFEQGYIPMIGANWVQMLSDKDTKMASVITDQLKNFFEITAYTNSDKIMRAPSQSIPIMYMGKLQNQARVQAIQKEIALWATKKGTKTGDALKEWHKENDNLIDMLKRESSKLTADQLHPDLIKGLEAFIQMSENFNIMTSIEDKVLAVKEQLKVMEFEKKNGTVVYGPESNAYRLYEHVLNSVFYGEQAAHSFTEKAINKIMKVTSAISIPLNIFGMLNNKFMARVNNRIDSIGSDFFSRKSYNRMIGLYNTEHIPGYIRTRFENIGNKTYSSKKAGSLYEGLEHKFQMVRHLNTNESRVDFLSEIGGYAGYEAGEWEVQSLVGNAILDSIQMKYIGNDPKLQDCSVYDAHKFDPNTGKTTLIEGYKYLDKDGNIAADQQRVQHLIINRIHETNDRIHGNYDPANKIMLERNYAGKLILQFHKWVYPNFKSRYQAGKFDENLGGGMDIEGRYQSLWTFIKAITKLGVSADRWNELTEHQRSNLKKDLADAIYVCSLFAFATIVRSATEGLGDDDPYVKRMRNWLLYQSDRGLQEVSIFIPGFGLAESYQLLNNPFAATGTLRNFAVILKDSFEYPFQDDEHRYIQRGNFKGESHLYNNLQKVVPIEKELRQWSNLQSISSFYLGNSK